MLGRASLTPFLALKIDLVRDKKRECSTSDLGLGLKSSFRANLVGATSDSRPRMAMMVFSLSCQKPTCQMLSCPQLSFSSRGFKCGHNFRVLLPFRTVHSSTLGVIILFQISLGLDQKIDSI